MTNEQHIANLTMLERVELAIENNDARSLASLLRDAPGIDFHHLIRRVRKSESTSEGVREIVATALINVLSPADKRTRALIKLQSKAGTNTALHIAARKEKFQVVEDLLEGGADPFIRNAAGQRPVDLKPNMAISIKLRLHMISSQSSFITTINDEIDFSAFLDHIPLAAKLDLADKLLTTFSQRLKGDFRDHIIALRDPTPLHYMADKHAAAFLDHVLLACPELDVNSLNHNGQSPLDIAASSGDLESVVLLVEYSAHYSPELIDSLYAKLTDGTCRDHTAMISIMRYLLNKTEHLVKTPRPVPATGLIRLFNTPPATSTFQHPNDYDDLVNGYKEENKAGSSSSSPNPLRRLLNKSAVKSRRPVDSLATKLLSVSLSACNPGILKRFESVGSRGSAEKLMMAFHVLVVDRSDASLEFLRLVNPWLKPEDHAEGLAQYRLAWRDFVILVKVNEDLDRGSRPWLSIKAVEESGSLQAKVALERAKTWYDNFDEQLLSEMDRENIALMQVRDKRTKWNAVEGVPNLQVLCKRQLLKGPVLQAPHIYLSIFNRKPAHSLQPTLAISHTDEAGHPAGGYIGASTSLHS